MRIGSWQTRRLPISAFQMELSFRLASGSVRQLALVRSCGSKLPLGRIALVACVWVPQ